MLGGIVEKKKKKKKGKKVSCLFSFQFPISIISLEIVDPLPSWSYFVSNSRLHIRLKFPVCLFKYLLIL